MTTAPRAGVQSLTQHHVQVICPYCGKPHTHAIDRAAPGSTIRRAPGCGLVRTEAERLTGYRITLRKDHDR